MSDPGVKRQKGFFSRLRGLLSGGSAEDDGDEPDPTPAGPADGVRTMTAKKAAWWIGGRSPGTGTKPEVYQQVMNGEIEVVRSDGTVYNPGGQL